MSTSGSEALFFADNPLNNFSYCEQLLHIKTDTIEFIIILIMNYPAPSPKTKEAVGSVRRFLQYCQLSNKNSRDISRHICNFSRYFKIFIYLFIARFLVLT